MSRRTGFGTINNGITQNERAIDHPGRLDPSRASRERQVYYQGLSDGHNLPQAASGGKFNNFNHAVRSPNVNPNLSSLPNDQLWSRPPPYQNSQERHYRYPLNSAASNGNLSVQPQIQLANHQKQPYQHRRQSQSSRPQVRLPSIPDDIPPKNSTLQSTQVNRDSYNPLSDLKIHSIPQPSQFNDVQSKQYNFGRHHKSSISNSSRTSTENNSCSTDLGPSKSSSLTSAETPCDTSSTHSRPRPSYSPHDIDEEWLLLREETMRKPRDTPRDKYSHIHPIVRKYAAYTIPEVKMEEHQWANSGMSRLWQEEEKLERDKKEMLKKKEEGIDPPQRPATCMTEQQDRANRIAQLTLAMLREFDEKNQENNDEEKNVTSETTK